LPEHNGTTFSYAETESHNAQRCRRTDVQTDVRHHDANSRSYYDVAVESAKNYILLTDWCAVSLR